MKKFFFNIILSAVIVCVLSGACAVSASEENYCPRGVAESVKSMAGVKDCSVIYIGDKAVAAVLPQAIFTKSDKDFLKQNILLKMLSYRKTAKAAVTFDLDVYLKMKKLEEQIKSGAAITDISEDLISVVSILEKRGELIAAG